VIVAVEQSRVGGVAVAHHEERRGCIAERLTDVVRGRDEVAGVPATAGGLTQEPGHDGRRVALSQPVEIEHYVAGQLYVRGVARKSVLAVFTPASPPSGSTAAKRLSSSGLRRSGQEMCSPVLVTQPRELAPERFVGNAIVGRERRENSVERVDVVVLVAVLGE
jgi:hypothetical protein